MEFVWNRMSSKLPSHNRIVVIIDNTDYYRVARVDKKSHKEICFVTENGVTMEIPSSCVKAWAYINEYKEK